MFCGKCGVQNEDDALFCAGCGAKFNGGQAVKSVTPIAVTPDDKNRKVGIIAVAVIAVAVIGIIFYIFGGRSYEKVIKKYVDATYDVDAEAIMDLMPEGFLEYAFEESGYDMDDFEDEYEDLIDDANDSLESMMDSLEEYLGDDWKLSYEITDVDDVKGDDLEDLQDEYEDADIKVSAAKELELEIIVKSGEDENSNTMDIPVIKIGRSWYLDAMSMGMSGLF